MTRVKLTDYWELMIGGGQQEVGHDLIEKLAIGLTAARVKHPLFAEGPYHALGVIGDEFRELEQAVEKESSQRQREEALDVAITALRFVMGEHEAKTGDTGNG